MTHINPTAAAARERARASTGMFGAQEHSAPESALNPRAQLDTVNALYQENTDLLREEVGLYLQYGMPDTAHRVEFEESDQGEYVFAARAFDADGAPIDIEDDYDRWADADDVIAILGHPDENRPAFATLFESKDGRVFTWSRTSASNDADEQAIRDRIDRLTAVRRELADASHTSAIDAARRQIPEGSQLTLAWGDQGYLTVSAITLADGTELDEQAASAAGIDWDELDITVSDIHDTGDLIHQNERPQLFLLDQKVN